MTEHVRLIPNDGTAELLDGDCGIVLTVLRTCPNEPLRALRCACGAEIVPRGSTELRSATPPRPSSAGLGG